MLQPVEFALMELCAQVRGVGARADSRRGPRGSARCARRARGTPARRTPGSPGSRSCAGPGAAATRGHRGTRARTGAHVENRENTLNQHTLEAPFDDEFLVRGYLRQEMPIPSAVPKGA